MPAVEALRFWVVDPSAELKGFMLRSAWGHSILTKTSRSIPHAPLFAVNSGSNGLAVFPIRHNCGAPSGARPGDYIIVIQPRLTA